MLSVRHGENVHLVPCGKSAYCLTNRRSSWMFRITQEMRSQVHPGWFITLTYDEKHVKRVGTPCRLSLRFRDVQLFLKRVRKEEYYAKYICVGEYGGVTGRPHYHVILWTDCPIDYIESFWKMGHVHVGRLNMASAMYTLKYIIQPKPPEYDGVERPRAQFSKGLGLSYLSADVYNYHTADYDNPIFHSYVGSQKVALPKYYRDKIFTKYQQRRNGHKVKWQSIKKRRMLMRALLRQGCSDTKKVIAERKAFHAQQIIKNTKFNLTF